MIDSKEVLNKYLQLLIEYSRVLPYVTITDIIKKLTLTLPDIFIEPRVRETSPDSVDKSEQEKYFSGPFSEILSRGRGRHFILLGAPGSGKSVLLKHLAIKKAEELLNRQENKSLQLPIYVELHRLYPAFREAGQGNYNILDFLYDSARTTLSITLPRGFFEQYLENGGAIVMLDGLNEVPSDVREELIPLIHLFAERFKNNTLIVTSRKVAYKRSLFPGGDYTHLTLENFDDEMIDSLIRQSYKLSLSDPNEALQKAQELREFLEQTPSLESLSRTPSGLLLIAGAYRFKTYLPADRLELYDNLTNEYLQTWSSKGRIRDKWYNPEDIKRFLSKLAFHMQSRLTHTLKQDEVYDILSPDFTLVYNLEKKEAPALVDEFLKILKWNSWLMAETSPRHYGFTHQFLQEYFAAMYIAFKNIQQDDAKILIETLYQFVEVPANHEILLLALGAIPKENAHKVFAHLMASWSPPPFYLNSLTIENTKCFKGKHFLNLSHEDGTPAKWTVILGNNGTGKTTLLQSIAQLDIIRIKQAPAFKVPERGRPNFELSVQNENRQQDEQYKSTINGRVHYKEKKQSPVTEFLLGNIDSIYNSRFQGMPLSEIYDLTVYAYGASRVSGEAALTRVAGGNRHDNLFENKELMNAEEWLVQADYAVKKGVGPNAEANLEKIKKILLDILPDVKGFDFKTESNYRNYIEFLTDYGPVRFRDLSMGYQVMISWVVDLARQMFERYPQSKCPLSEPAVVLVDEIDLHLHPSWQREVVHFLSKHFKKAQFIVTAHSPLIIQSAERINVVLLQKDPDKESATITNIVNTTYNGWTLEEILNDLMGLEKTVSDRYLTLTKKFEKAVYNEDAETAAKIYGQLDSILHPENHTRKLLRIQMASLGGDKLHDSSKTTSKT